jgi:hypothetical protein
MKKILIFYSLFSIILMIACGPGNRSGENQTASDMESQADKEILVSPVTDSPEFPDAILEMNDPDEFARLEPGNLQFSYDVTNYELRAQTSDADSKNCANSADGQHIHLILNNQPYTAHYEPSFEQEVNPGHYVALSFLSRSYHESIKTPEAYVLRQFTVGNAEAEEVDLNGPLLFYSRPKGSYSGEDTHKILLDFYLVNCDLSQDGYKVRATINGHEFMFNEWVPYFVEGLPMGENEFIIELLDADGNLVDSPFNRTERTITLEGGPSA